MEMIEWAKKEVKIACTPKDNCTEENKDCFGYFEACCESALKAFQSLVEDNHSGFSIKATQSILNDLINGKPLTPIEDTDDVWNEITDRQDGYTTYQCKRMSSLFKDVYNDGTVKYHDVDRVSCINMDNPSISWYSGDASRMVDEMYPINMPYTADTKYVIYAEDFLTDESHGDYDTRGFLYMDIEKNGKKERVDLNIFHYYGSGNTPIELTREEYDKLKEKRINK